MPPAASMQGATIAEREAELAALQSAFDEYITSSRELEEELDAELSKMQERLAESSAANSALSAQLENIAPQLASLERALSEAKSKLDTESQLRRQAELAQDDAEARCREAEGSLASLKEDCDAAHEELAFRESELEETRLELAVEKERHRVELDDVRADLAVALRGKENDESAEQHDDDGQEHLDRALNGGPNNSKTAAETTIDEDGFPAPAVAEDGRQEDDYVKRLEDELELVTEQLIETEQRLSQTEQKLAETEERAGPETASSFSSDDGEEKKQNDETIMRLKEENHLSKEKELQLKEELELCKEEVALIQEELHAAEDDSKRFGTQLEEAQAGHREQVSALRQEIDKSEAEARTATAELETIEKTLQAATVENEELKSEVSNLNVALDNAKKDHAAVVEELDAVNERFDEVRQEAEATGRQAAEVEVRSEMEASHQVAMEELNAHLKALSVAKAVLQEKLDHAEMEVAAARDTQHEGDEDHDEMVSKLQNQLARVKVDLAEKEKEVDELNSALETRVAKAEGDVTRLEKELASTKGKLAEAEAHLIVTKRDMERASAAIPQKTTQAHKTPVKALASDVSTRSESVNDLGHLATFGESHALSRRLRHADRRRSRSSSPTTPQRLHDEVSVEATKVSTLQKKYDLLMDQNRMGEVRIKRLEADLKSLQMQLLSSQNGDAPVVTQMSRLSSLSSSPQKQRDGDDVRDLGVSNIEDVIESRDPKRIAEELRALDKKSSMQREYNTQLLSKILSLQGNIQVFCRVRPMRIVEIQKGEKNAVEALGETEVGCVDSRTKKWKSFAFDRVWGPDQPQHSVFQDVEPIALSVVDGYNACIFAYGQTGSGKTYTMEGISKDNQHGVSYRTIQKLFNLLNLRAQQQKAAAMAVPEQDETREDEEKTEGTPSFEFTLEVGMLEIYNDEVFDLLVDLPEGATAEDKKREARKSRGKATLDIRQNAEGRVEVPNLTKEKVTSIDDVMSLLQRGNSNRATASTDLNEHSSRSHMVLTVAVSSGVAGQSGNKGTLYLVDLAGSERVKRSNVGGDQLKEAGYINKSLSALGNVMEALDRKASHIPYRDSKLTYLLQDSLGGNSRTLMVVTVCPMDSAFDESVHALQFATRVRRIQIGAAQRNVTSRNLEETVKSLTAEMKMLTKSKEKSEMQLHSLKRDNARVKDRLQTLSESRAKSHAESRTLEVLRKNSTEMANRWQKEKTMREKTSAELEKAQTEMKRIQQQLTKLTRERDTLSRKLEEKENLLLQSTKDLRHAKDASSAANIRARTAQIMNSRGGTRTPAKPRSPTKKQNERNSSSASSTQNQVQDVSEIREQVLSLLQKYDETKVGRIDIIMDKFKGKESLLLEKMKERYEGSGNAQASLQRRSEMALARHKERMKKKMAQNNQ